MMIKDILINGTCYGAVFKQRDGAGWSAKLVTDHVFKAAKLEELRCTIGKALDVPTEFIVFSELKKR